MPQLSRFKPRNLSPHTKEVRQCPDKSRVDYRPAREPAPFATYWFRNYQNDYHYTWFHATYPVEIWKSVGALWQKQVAEVSPEERAKMLSARFCEGGDE